jgi:hypothetical protein
MLCGVWDLRLLRVVRVLGGPEEHGIRSTPYSVHGPLRCPPAKPCIAANHSPRFMERGRPLNKGVPNGRVRLQHRRYQNLE